MTSKRDDRLPLFSDQRLNLFPLPPLSPTIVEHLHGQEEEEEEGRKTSANYREILQRGRLKRGGKSVVATAITGSK